MAELTPEMRAKMRRAAGHASRGIPDAWEQSTRQQLAICAEGDRHRHRIATALDVDAAVHIAAACPANVIALLDYCDRLERKQTAAHERMHEMAEVLEPIADVANSYTVQTAAEDYIFTLRPRGSNRMTGLRRKQLIDAARVLADYRKGNADG